MALTGYDEILGGILDGSGAVMYNSQPRFQLPGTTGGVSGDVGSGFGIPGTGGAANICPPGTACGGISVQLPGGFAGCLGKCQPIGPSNITTDTGSVGGTPSGGMPSGTCDLPTQAYCQATCGTNGSKCRTAGACSLGVTASGRQRTGRLNSCGECVPKRRKMNPANAKASARAARRVTMAIKHQDKLVKTMKKTMKGR